MNNHSVHKNRKQKALEERHRIPQGKRDRIPKELREKVKDSLVLGPLIDGVRVKKSAIVAWVNAYRQGYIRFKVDCKLQELEEAAQKRMTVVWSRGNTIEYWDNLEAEMIKEWKIRQTKLYKALN